MKVDSDNWIGTITFNCSYFYPIGSWIHEHWVPGLRNHWPCLKEFSSFFIDFPNKFCRIKPGSHIRWLEPGTHTRNNRNILLTSTDSTWFTITILRDTPLDFFRFWAMLLSSNFGKWSIFLTMVKLSNYSLGAGCFWDALNLCISASHYDQYIWWLWGPLIYGWCWLSLPCSAS